MFRKRIIFSSLRKCLRGPDLAAGCSLETSGLDQLLCMAFLDEFNVKLSCGSNTLKKNLEEIQTRSSAFIKQRAANNKTNNVLVHIKDAEPLRN